MQKIRNDRTKYVTRASLVIQSHDSKVQPTTKTAADYRDAAGDDDGYITFRKSSQLPGRKGKV